LSIFEEPTLDTDC